MILFGVFQSLFNDKIGLEFFIGVCKFCVVQDGVRMQLNIYFRGILIWEEIVNFFCDLKIVLEIFFFNLVFMNQKNKIIV